MALVKTGSEIINSTIGENSFFSGKFFINGSLRIDGKFEGQSLQAEQIYVGETGRVKTDIMATSVIVEGIVVGNITARNRIMLLPTARVLGDITTPELIIQNGVVLEGRCLISNNSRQSASEFIETEYKKDNLSGDRLFTNKKGK